MDTDSAASRAEARHQARRARTIRRNASRGLDAIIGRVYGEGAVR